MSETGHAKNVANLDELISYATGWGTAFNPTKASLMLTALQALSKSGQDAINAVNAAIPAYTNSVAAREAAFAPLNKLVTRAVNALKATDTTIQVDESAKTFSRKIQGRRATPKMTEEEKKAASAAGKEVVEISSSQMSFDSRLDNFDKLIKLLSSITLYAPNEADLQVASLTTLYNDLKVKNNVVITAATMLSNSRILRNEILYKMTAGFIK